VIMAVLVSFAFVMSVFLPGDEPISMGGV